MTVDTADTFWVTLAPGPALDVWTERPKLYKLADGHTVRWFPTRLKSWYGSYPLSAPPTWIKTVPDDYRQCVRHGPEVEA